jgi:hypothetical protein
VAQLGARLTGSQKVRGSNPLGSTKSALRLQGGSAHTAAWRLSRPRALNLERGGSGEFVVAEAKLAASG